MGWRWSFFSAHEGLTYKIQSEGNLRLKAFTANTFAGGIFGLTHFDMLET